MSILTSGNLKNRGGRPKGAKNKLGQSAKDAIADAASGLGGSARLMSWAKEDPLNERSFWSTIYPKLLPLDVQASGDFKLDITIAFK